MSKPPCGLICCKTRALVPLQSINVHAVVKGFVSEVTCTLVYKNSGTDHIEAAFTFPVDDNSAVYRFEAKLDGRTITSEVQEKKQAKETYDDAIQAGHAATLLEESDSSGDIFHCKIGNLGPSSEAILIISMVTELRLTTDGAATFILPTVLCPRYNPSVSDGGIPSTPKVPYVSLSSVPYSFNFDATIESSDVLLNVKSLKDSIKCDYLDEMKKQAKITLTSQFVPDHDLSFDIYFSNPYNAKVLVEKGSEEKGGLLGRDVGMVNFFPEIKEDGYSRAQEFIYVIDRSGSMSGARIESAKETLLLLLKSMPVGCYFNIVSFGSSFEALFTKGSREFSGATLAQAFRLQEAMDANFGGTEILAPLTDIYSKAPMTTHARQIFLLTDGQVSNTGAVINLVEKHSNDTRVFAIGIGEGVSTSLITGVARAGRGQAEFVTGKDRLQSKVMKTMKAAMQESVAELSIVCEPDVKLTLIPQTMPRIFSGDKLVVYAMWPEGEKMGDVKVTLKGKIGEKPFETSSSVTGSVLDNGTMAIHRLAAKAQIKELETKETDENKRKIVLLSTTANIVSKYTSMVGVDKEKKVKIGILSLPKPPVGMLYSQEIVNLQSLSAGPVSEAASSRSRLRVLSAPIRKKENLSHHEIPVPPKPPVRMRYSQESAPLMVLSAGPVSEAASSRSRSGVLSAPRPIRKKETTDMAPSDMATSIKGMNPVAARVCELMNESDDFDDYSKEDECDEEEESSPVGKPTPPDYMALVVLQSFSGSWRLDAKLAKVLQKDLKELETASPIANKEVWATILAVVFLEEEFAQKKDEWEMVVMKAEQWLGTQQQELEGKDVSSLRAEAKALVGLLIIHF